MLAADFLVSTFAAAAKSVRRDTVLRPYPPPVLRAAGGEKNYETLRRLFDTIPQATVLLQEPSVPSTATATTTATTTTTTTVLSSTTAAAVSPHAWDLLHWVLHPPNCSIRLVPAALYASIRARMGTGAFSEAPAHIFEVEHTGSTAVAFDQACADNGVTLGYHGTSPENLHSILRVGFVTSMNTTKLYGEGTYLSTDLNLSIDFAPFARCWHRSELGHSLSFIIVCEVVRGSGVRFGGDLCPSGGDSDNRTVRVPDGYIVAPDSSRVRPKYVFVYAREPGLSQVGRARRQQSWFRQNLFIVCLALYVLLLIAVGMARSKAGRKLLRQWGLVA